MNAKVNVSARLDADVSAIQQKIATVDGDLRKYYEQALIDASEASAAFSGLIDVIKEVDALWPYLPCVCGRNHCRHPAELRDRLRAALARVQGGAL